MQQLTFPYVHINNPDQPGAESLRKLTIYPATLISAAGDTSHRNNNDTAGE